MRLVLFILMLLGFSLGQETRFLELELLIAAPPEILFNYVNPVVFTLTTLHAEIQIEATGELYQDDPEIYWQMLNPVLWKLELPEDTNILDVHITARLALCDKEQGLCYFQDVDLEKKITLKQPINKQTLHIKLDRPGY